MDQIFRLPGNETARNLIPPGCGYNLHFERRSSGDGNTVDITFLETISGHPPLVLSPDNPQVRFEFSYDFNEGAGGTLFRVRCELLPLDQTTCLNPGVSCTDSCHDQGGRRATPRSFLLKSVDMRNILPSQGAHSSAGSAE